MSRYRAMQLDSGKWGVVDFSEGGLMLVAAGMTKQDAEAWADRQNLRSAWGV